MKKNLKKGLSFLLVLILAISITITGCSKNNNQENQNDNKEVSQDGNDNKEVSKNGNDNNENENVKEQLEKVSLKFHFPGEEKKDLAKVLGRIEEEMAETVNADLTFYMTPQGDYKDKMLLLTASGEVFDGGFMGDFAGYLDLVQKEVFYNVKEEFPVYAPNLYSQYDKSTLDLLSYKGGLYLIPWQKNISFRNMFTVRTDIAEKIDFEYGDVTTFEDISNILPEIKEAAPEILSFSLGNWGAPLNMWLLGKGYHTFSHNYAYKYDDPELKLIPIEQTEGFDEYISLISEWYENGYINKNQLAVQESDEQEMYDGKIASSLGWPGVVFTRQAATVASNNPEWKGLTVSPMYPDEKAPVQPLSANGLFVNVTSENPERVLMFYNWVYESQENFDLLLYGIEGEHYNLTEDGLLEQPDGYTAANNPWLGWTGQWGFWHQDFMRDSTDDDIELLKVAKKINNLNVMYKLDTGFVQENDLIETEIAKRTSVWKEKMNPLLVGLPTDYTLDDVRQDLKNAGEEKMTSELQKQIDDFLANK